MNKYLAIKCSECANNIPSFMSDILGYEAEIADVECKPQLCTNCAPPLGPEELKKAHEYLVNKFYN